MAVLFSGERNETERKFKHQNSDIPSMPALKNPSVNQCINTERAPQCGVFGKCTDLFTVKLESL